MPASREGQVIALELMRPAGIRTADLMDQQLMAALATVGTNKWSVSAPVVPKTEWRLHEHA